MSDLYIMELITIFYDITSSSSESVVFLCGLLYNDTYIAALPGWKKNVIGLLWGSFPHTISSSLFAVLPCYWVT